MSLSRVVAVSVSLHLLAFSAWAADIHYQSGHSHLAILSDKAPEWRVLHVRDAVESPSQLRTSPQGPAQISLPDGDLTLGADTAASLNAAEQTIVLHRGRARLVVAESAKISWRLVSGQQSVTCPKGVEIAMTSGRTQPVIDLLAGQIEVRQNDQPEKIIGSYVAPMENVTGDGQRADVATLKGGVAAWQNRARAATEVRAVQGLGQLITKDAQSGTPMRLEVARYHVNVVLKPPVALVQIDQSFFNPFANQQEGQFIFNLPDGASVSRFAMYVTHEDLIEGELIERARADKIYTTIVRSRRDPAILEQIGDNLFRMRVFPIFARDTKRILLDFTVPLVADHGRFAFNLPLMSDLKPIWDFSLKGTIHSPFEAASIQSVTHPQLKFFNSADGTISFASKSEKILPPSHFSLRYSAPPDPQSIVRSYKPAGEKDPYFVITVPASANPPAVRSEQPLDLLLLVDTSGPPRSLALAFQAARSAAAGLRPTDRIHIGCLDSSYRPLNEGWAASGSTEADAAWRRLTQQFAMGTTDLDTTFPLALQTFSQSAPERRKLAVYIGDAPPRVGLGSTTAAAPLTAEVSHEFCAVKLGDSRAGMGWLSRRVAEKKGLLFDVKANGESLDDLFEWSLAGSPLQNTVNRVEIAGVDASNLFYEHKWPQGRELHLYGKGPVNESMQVTLTVNDQAVPLSAKANEQQQNEDIFTGRLWASQKLQSLLGAPDAQSVNAQAAIVRLCQEWSLMSPLTAFLVLETENDYVRWNVDRKIRRRYWAPAGTATAAPLASSAVRPLSKHDVEAARLAARNRVTQVMALAEQKLAQGGDISQVLRLLASIHRDAQANAPDKYQDLKRRAEAKLKPQLALPELKLWRPLADRRSSELTPPVATPLLAIADVGISAEFLEANPQARELLRTISDCPIELSLPDFVKLIQLRTGLPVVLDRASLSDEGVRLDMDLDLNGLSGVTIRSLLKEGLGQYGLECISLHNYLKITTRARADETLATRVYPVADLVSPDLLPVPHRLANPYLDVEIAARRRLSAKLKQPVSVDFLDTPLDNALAYIADVLGTPIRLDKTSLADEGVNSDQQVELKLDDVPAEVVLKTLLEQLGLEAIIQNETIKVSTQARADETFDLQLYSALGIEELTPAAQLQRRRRSNGFDMGGMGGGFFGGGGMGGMAGGMGVGGAPAPAQPQPQPHQETSVEPFDIAAPNVSAALNGIEADEASATGESFVADQPPLTPEFSEDRLTASADNLVALLQKTTRSKWVDLDQEGGAVEYFPLSHSLVVRQTYPVQIEIQDLLKQLRRHVAGNLPQATPDIAWADQGARFRSLERLLETCLSGKWIEVDQEGGSLQSNLPTNTLTVRQTHAMHEEIANLLTQLRRARYGYESAWQHPQLAFNDDSSIVRSRSVTNLPLSVKTSAEATPDEIQWLAGRHTGSTISQRWRNRLLSTSHQGEFSIRRSDTRLELALPDRTIRIEGGRAAVAYPGLALVEIDDWGTAALQLADAALPWLPHRSNQELAALFDITLVEEDSKSITLRLNFPGIADTYLQPTFSKLTRQPTQWLSVAGGQPQFTLEFEAKTVIARDPQNREIERWELIVEDASRSVPELNRDWGQGLVVDLSHDQPTRKLDGKADASQGEATTLTVGSLYLASRQSLAQGNYAEARRLLLAALQKQPDQPLLNLLLAWTGELMEQRNDAEVQANRAALQRVCTSQAHELIRLITSINFPSRSAEIHEILLSVPVDQRSTEVWIQLAEYDRAAGRHDTALSLIEKGLAAASRAEAKRRCQILRVGLLLQTGKQSEAIKAAQLITAADDRQLVQLADLFAGVGLYEMHDSLMAQLRQRSQPAGIELAQLLERQADNHPIGKRRWELLLEAMAAIPKDRNYRAELLGLIRDEATSNEHAIILGEFAKAQQNDDVRVQLKIRQADLLDDRQQAADIILDLKQAGWIKANRLVWALNILKEADRSAEIVAIVEAQLRRGVLPEKTVLQNLRDAYLKRNQVPDAQRAETESVRVSPLPPAPFNAPATGFFSVK